ncbi:hypothetical protein TWF679_005495 [Orbilia oligospora]|uniref:Uncharacterized protein n=2 Tax=Orbilia oligospora TaxID=2813651 RepID=A0A8H8VBN0_ORBOL|nr:hypothetical protein TWF679_005495 [Orbilia oligospora]
MADQDKQYGGLRADRNELETLRSRPVDEKTTVESLLDCGPKIRDPSNHKLLPKTRATSEFKSGTLNSESQTPASSDFSLQDFDRRLEELRAIFLLGASETEKQLNDLESSLIQLQRMLNPKTWRPNRRPRGKNASPRSVSSMTNVVPRVKTNDFIKAVWGVLKPSDHKLLSPPKHRQRRPRTKSEDAAADY